MKKKRSQQKRGQHASGKNNAESIKTAGNALFAKGQYDNAASYYARALDLAEKSQDPYLQAVCLSNISNCRFERGRYAESIEGAVSCLKVLEDLQGNDNGDFDELKMTELRLKNQLRMARSYYYSDKRNECQKILEQLRSSGNKAYVERAQKMLQGLEASAILESNSNIPSSTKPTRLLRAALYEPFCENYRFGHDKAMSALDQWDSDPSPKLQLKTTSRRGKFQNLVFSSFFSEFWSIFWKYFNPRLVTYQKH